MGLYVQGIQTEIGNSFKMNSYSITITLKILISYDNY